MGNGCGKGQAKVIYMSVMNDSFCALLLLSWEEAAKGKLLFQ